jgi:hypothetical protein
MPEILNHTCSICGKKYSGCDTCDSTKTYMPWRTIVDTQEHYKIFMIIRDYENKHIDKSEAKKQLSKIDLSEKDNFVIEIKNKIDEILQIDNVSVKRTNQRKK